MAGDSWLNEYEECSTLGQELMEQINERNKHARTSSAYTKLSASIRTNLRKFNSDVNRLKQNLIRASSSYHITQREVERRQGMMDALVSKEKQIEQASRNEGGSSYQGRKGDKRLLLEGEGRGDSYSSSDPWGMRDDSDNVFQDMNNTDLHQQQQHVIREQDRGLEALSNVIGRQKEMALDIGREVDDQNVLIDDITNQVDRTDSRVQRETRHIRIVDRKSNTCCYYVVIALLFVAMIIVIAVPFHGKP